jgi:hypothetical protein
MTPQQDIFADRRKSRCHMEAQKAPALRWGKKAPGRVGIKMRFRTLGGKSPKRPETPNSIFIIVVWRICWRRAGVLKIIMVCRRQMPIDQEGPELSLWIVVDPDQKMLRLGCMKSTMLG